MRKKLLIVVLLAISCLFTGCDSIEHTLRYGNENSTSEISTEYNYFVTRIPNEELPDGWSSCDYMSYYYHIDTKIIYFGSNNLSTNGVMLVELKSKDFRNYIYDTKTKEFIGIK